MTKGTLYIVPSPIAEETQFEVIPKSVVEVLRSSSDFIVEDVRTARRFLSSLRIFDSIERLNFSVLDKDTNKIELIDLFAAIECGRNICLLSESGCPGIADPGALAVQYAHEHSIAVVPMVGPSSIILSLMASGMNGQNFAFHGYLPFESKQLKEKIAQLELESRKKQQTQIFIETPYRNKSLLNSLIKYLQNGTRLCVCEDLTGKSQSITNRTIGEWKNSNIALLKIPTIYLILA